MLVWLKCLFGIHPWQYDKVGMFSGEDDRRHCSECRKTDVFMYAAKVSGGGRWVRILG